MGVARKGDKKAGSKRGREVRRKGLFVTRQIGETIGQEKNSSLQI